MHPDPGGLVRPFLPQLPTMNRSLLLCALLIATGTALSQDSAFVLPFVPVEKEVPAEDEADGEGSGEEEVPEIIEDPAPGDWFPGGWDPDWVKRGDDPDVILYTLGDGDDDPVLYPEDEAIELDPVIYQSAVPAAPKQSRKEKQQALQADIVDGCVVTYGAWDRDGNGALDLTEFAARWSGPAKSSKRAFKRIDKNRDGLITASEFSMKGSVPLVMPASLDLPEANDAGLSFNALDFDGNGFLTFGEFTAVLRPSGPGVLEAIFAEADRNGDGKISFAEYTHRQVRPAGVE